MPTTVQSDKPDFCDDSTSSLNRHNHDRSLILLDDEEDSLAPEYDARQALRLRRGLLDPRATSFRRSLQSSRDKSSWNVRCRVLGGGGEFFFTLEPSLLVRRPVHRVFLNLRTDRRSAWNQRLPVNWRDIDIRIACSRDFSDEVGLSGPLYLRSELQDQLSREEFNLHVADTPGQTLYRIFCSVALSLRRERMGLRDVDDIGPKIDSLLACRCQMSPPMARL